MTRRLLNYATYSILAFVRGLWAPADFVFVGTDPFLILPTAIALSWLRGARLVLDERDLYPETAVALGILTPGPVVTVLERWSAFVRRRASHVIAATPGVKAALVRKGVTADSVTVLFNAFPPDPGVAGFEDVEARLLGRFVVLYSGSMGQAFQLTAVLDAARILREKASPVFFIFVGEGEAREGYLKYCRELRLDNCLFLPAVKRRDMCGLLRLADVGIVSVRADPFWRMVLPSKFFDFLAFGKPVVVAGDGDMADILQASGGGFIVPAGDAHAIAAALQRLTMDPELGAKMGHANQRYFQETFSLPKQRQALARAFST